MYIHIDVLQSPSCVQFFTTPLTVACQASLSLTISWSLPKFMPIAYLSIYLSIYTEREREREREREWEYIYNQELVHDITEAGESKICTSRLAGCWLREEPMLKSKGYQDRANVAVQVQRLSSAWFPLAQRRYVLQSIQGFNWLV